MMKEAKIKFTKDTQAQYWTVEVVDKQTKKVIYTSREKLGIKGKLSTSEKIDCMRMSIGKVINEMGYYF